MLAWLSVWSEVQTCIWFSWCHCHSPSLASVKSRLALPFWYRLTWVVPGKGPLSGCSKGMEVICMLSHFMPLTPWIVTDYFLSWLYFMESSCSNHFHVFSIQIYVYVPRMLVCSYFCMYASLTNDDACISAVWLTGCELLIMYSGRVDY